MEQKFKLDTNKQPEQYNALLKWYNYLLTKFDTKLFSRAQAIAVFEEHTCNMRANTYINSLIATDAVVKA